MILTEKIAVQNKSILFDFDSTFIQQESLDELATLCLAHHPNYFEKLETIRTLTSKAMEGTIKFQEGLKKRFSLIQAEKKDIHVLIESLKQQITPSFMKHRSFFKHHQRQIYILSSGFFEIIWPIVEPFGILKDHIFANHLRFNFEDKLIGFDENNVLSQDQGKVKTVQQLNLPGEVFIIGDGYTDYEVKKAGVASKFFLFQENIQRHQLAQVADEILTSLEGLFEHIQYSRHIETTSPKAILFENIHPKVADQLRKCGFSVKTYKEAIGPEHFTQLADIDFLGVRSKSELHKSVLEKAQKLSGIGAFCIGTNQIDIEYCNQQGICIFNAPFSNTRSVVELALANIFMLFRNLFEKCSQCHQGSWTKSADGAHEIRGKTLGIVGYGNIGTQLSVLAESLGMDIYYYDIVEKMPLGNAKSCQTLEELLKISDVVSLHVDGRSSNQHLMNESTIRIMKPRSFLINLSRGFVVDEKALKKYLDNEHLAGVALDVFSKEPSHSQAPFNFNLQNNSKVILTPHIGGSTQEAQEKIGEFVGNRLIEHHQHGSTMFSINFPHLKLPAKHNGHRLIHVHENVPGMLAKINALFAQYNINVDAQHLKTNENMGYVISDIPSKYPQELLKKVHAIPHTRFVRVINSST